MRHPIFTSARLTDIELITVLKCLKTQRNETYEGFCTTLGLDRSMAGRLNNAFNGKTSGLNQLSTSIIRRLDEIYDEQLFRNIRNMDDSDESLYARLVYPKIQIDHALAGLLDEKESQRQFSRLRAGTKGNYYILRMSSPSEIVCSWMHISPSTAIHPLPRFITVRQRRGVLSENIVKGVIFESGSQIYSFGKTQRGFGFRAAIVKPYIRHHREDMIGVRLGMQDNPDRPVGYPIYCYQIDTEQREIRKLIGKHDVSAFLRSSELQGIKDIVKMLTHSIDADLEVGLPT